MRYFSKITLVILILSILLAAGYVYYLFKKNSESEPFFKSQEHIEKENFDKLVSISLPPEVIYSQGVSTADEEKRISLYSDRLEGIKLEEVKKNDDATDFLLGMNVNGRYKKIWVRGRLCGNYYYDELITGKVYIGLISYWSGDGDRTQIQNKYPDTPQCKNYLSMTNINRDTIRDIFSNSKTTDLSVLDAREYIELYQLRLSYK